MFSLLTSPPCPPVQWTTANSRGLTVFHLLALNPPPIPLSVLPVVQRWFKCYPDAWRVLDVVGEGGKGVVSLCEDVSLRGIFVQAIRE